MNENRLSHLLSPEPIGEVAATLVPMPPAGFALCPLGLVQSGWQQQLYLAAYERARIDLEPRRSRLLNLECWN